MRGKEGKKRSKNLNQDYLKYFFFEQQLGVFPAFFIFCLEDVRIIEMQA